MLNFKEEIQQTTIRSIVSSRLLDMIQSGPSELSKMITNQFGVSVTTGYNTLSFKLPAVDIEVIVTYVNGITYISIPEMKITKSYSNCSSAYVLDMINKLI